MAFLPDLDRASVSDLPIEQSTKFELIKTAKTLGINVQASILARADEAIE